MNETLVFEGRVVAVETKLETLTSAVHELTKAVREVMTRPQQIAWREIAITAGAFLALFAYVGQYLEGQYAKNIAPDRARLEYLERDHDRLRRVEAQLCILSPGLCAMANFGAQPKQ